MDDYCFLAQCDYQSGVSRRDIHFCNNIYYAPSAFGLLVSKSPFIQREGNLYICTDFSGYDKESGFCFGGHLMSSSSVDFLSAFNRMLGDLSGLIADAGVSVSDINASLLFGPEHSCSQHLNVYDLVVSYGFNVGLVYGANFSDNFLIDPFAGFIYLTCGLTGDKLSLIPRVVDKSFLCNSRQSPSLESVDLPSYVNLVRSLPVNNSKAVIGSDCDALDLLKKAGVSSKFESARLKIISSRLELHNRLLD